MIDLQAKAHRETLLEEFPRYLPVPPAIFVPTAIFSWEWHPHHIILQ